MLVDACLFQGVCGSGLTTFLRTERNALSRQVSCVDIQESDGVGSYGDPIVLVPFKQATKGLPGRTVLCLGFVILGVRGITPSGTWILILALHFCWSPWDPVSLAMYKASALKGEGE